MGPDGQGVRALVEREVVRQLEAVLVQAVGVGGTLRAGEHRGVVGEEDLHRRETLRHVAKIADACVDDAELVVLLRAERAVELSDAGIGLVRDPVDRIGQTVDEGAQRAELLVASLHPAVPEGELILLAEVEVGPSEDLVAVALVVDFVEAARRRTRTCVFRMSITRWISAWWPNAWPEAPVDRETRRLSCASSARRSRRRTPCSSRWGRRRSLRTACC